MYSSGVFTCSSLLYYKCSHPIAKPMHTTKNAIETNTMIRSSIKLLLVSMGCLIASRLARVLPICMTLSSLGSKT
jgi:hypothetical protein